MTQAPSLTATLMAARPAQGLSFADPGAAMGSDEVSIASLFHRQSTASEQEAPQRIEWLELDPSTGSALQADPTKGCLDPVIPPIHGSTAFTK
jgi:cyanate lyase